MFTLDDLAVFCGGDPAGFTGGLLRLMRIADPGNRSRLASAFAGEDLALRLWQALEAPTFGELAEAFRREATGSCWR